MVIKWTGVTRIDAIPLFNVVLGDHLNNLHGIVKYASCSAWNLLFQTLSEKGLPISTVDFTDTGKPYFINSDIHFSLSHSKGVCAVAISDQPVGVDVEVIKDSYNPHLIKRSLNENETAAFDGDFTRIWCRKEAVAKMTGEGITGYPNDIDTTGYMFEERQIEYGGLKYWLVAVQR